jgi:hypothetical protein
MYIIVGIGLGGLTSGVGSDLTYYAQTAYKLQHPLNGVDIQNYAPTMWIACLIIGAGLGAALAAVIPDNREPDRNRSEQPDEVRVV